MCTCVHVCCVCLCCGVYTVVCMAAPAEEPAAQHAAELPPRSLTRTGPATPGLQVRCDRRLAQGRARPIDYVAKGLYNLKGRAGGKEDMDDDDDDEEDEEAGESSSGAARGPGWPPPALCLLTAPPASLAALLARPQPLNHGLHTTPLHPQHTAELALSKPPAANRRARLSVKTPIIGGFTDCL